MHVDDLIGKKLPGGFYVHRYVAEGGFAWVYEAYTPERAKCAVKVPHQLGEDSLKRFTRETKILRELPLNPHCVSYVGHGHTEEGVPYLAMEYLDGQTLATVLEENPIWDVGDACALMTQLCSALRGMHRMGLANRDVTPANIMITEGNVLKLLDFGLVKDAQGLLNLLEEEDILAGADFAENIDRGLLVGTLDYVAPEQFLDSTVDSEEETQTDTWSDVYSVGLILYRMLTGMRLFRFESPGGDPAEYARRLLSYMRLRTNFSEDKLRRPPLIPDPLWEILVRSLRLEPRRRQRTAMELGRDLQRFLETGQVEQREDDATESIELGDFLAFLESHGASPGSGDGSERPIRVSCMSSIPVVLDFSDDEDNEVTKLYRESIPRQDRPPTLGDIDPFSPPDED